MDTVVVRYAEALRSLAIEENKVSDYKAAIKALLDAFKENPDLAILLSSAFIKKSDKRATVDKLFRSPETPSIAPFLKVLVDHGRIRELAKIGHEFIKLCNNTLGIEEGIIYSTTLLEKEKIAEIENAVSKMSGQKIELTNEIDVSLIGGIKVIVHDRIYDASVSSMIDSLQSELLKRKVINREN